MQDDPSVTFPNDTPDITSWACIESLITWLQERAETGTDNIHGTHIHCERASLLRVSKALRAFRDRCQQGLISDAAELKELRSGVAGAGPDYASPPSEPVPMSKEGADEFLAKVDEKDRKDKLLVAIDSVIAQARFKQSAIHDLEDARGKSDNARGELEELLGL